MRPSLARFAPALVLGLAATPLAPACSPAVPPPTGGPAAKASTSASASGSTAPTGLPGGAASSVVSGSKVPIVLFPLGFEPADERTLGPAEKLYVGDGGERWIVREKEGGAMSHEAAKQLAPESLVAARAVSDGWVFLGVTGTVFTAKTPLGPLESQRPAPRVFRAVTAGKDAFLGLSPNGELHRSVDRGQTWTEVALPGRHASAVLLSTAGLGLVLAPPRVFATTDDGATFAPVASPIGAVRLRLGAGDTVLAEGLGTVAPGKPGGPPRLSNYATASLQAGPKLVAETKSGRTIYFPYDGPHLSHASAIADGKATLVGGVVLEPFIDSSGDAPWWRLASYELGQQPGTSTLGLPPACADAFASSSGATAVIACVADPDPDKPNAKAQLIVVRSEDKGKSWVADPLVDFDGTLRRVRAVGKTGVILDVEDGGGTTHFVRVGKAKPVRVDWKLQKDEPLPSFSQLVGSDDGLHVYATASRTTKTKDGDEQTKLHLWVSKDGGRTFTSRPLPDPEPDNYLNSDPVLLSVEGTTVTLFAPWDAGRMARYATKDDGATFDRSLVAVEADQMVLVGDRGFATTSGPTPTAFESIDAGKTWTKVTLPTKRRWGFDAIACAKAGCVLGDRGVRLGWEVNGAGDVKPWKPEPTKAIQKPKAGAPLACAATGKAAKVPALEQLQWGERRAFGVQRGADGAFDVVVLETNAAGDAQSKVVPLFGKGKGKFASAVVASTEGVLVARAPAEATGPTVDVELAVFTATTGKAVVATLPKAITPPKPVGKKPPAIRLDLHGGVVPGFGAWVSLGDKLWSVAGAKATAPIVPEKMPLGENAFGLRAGGASHLVGFHQIGGAIAAFAFTLDDAAKAFSGRYFGLAPDVGFGGGNVTTATLLGGAPYVTVSVRGSDTTEGYAYALRVDDKGGDPMPLIAPSPLVACAGPQDASLRWELRPEFPVTVDGKMQWGTTSLVLRGTEKSCAASVTVRATQEGLSADLAGTGGVWLKRTGKDVEVRGLRCKLP